MPGHHPAVPVGAGPSRLCPAGLGMRDAQSREVLPRARCRGAAEQGPVRQADQPLPEVLNRRPTFFFKFFFSPGTRFL